ncbi:MAG: T9SS type A sorting domain-containing protein [Fidelibacterota bacterium]|nr:MAG: T9SS type A sorting domain-containing protein [Candidatus Neomarinimicrobiota bacterium]
MTNAEFTIDDGSGIAIINSDGTNDMSGEDMFGNPTTAGPWVIPPNGTTIASIRGYVYHAYGDHADTSTYRVRPIYHSDMVMGVGGPPLITGFAITESALGPTDAVTVSATITDGSAVASAGIFYRVNGGAWLEASMTPGASNSYSGTIPATDSEGALVEYYLEATDDGLNQDAPMSATIPSDTSAALYGYHTRAAGHTVHDIQYMPYSSGNSYYVGQVVSVSGVVTSTADQPDSRAGGFNIQDGPGIWNGIWAELDAAVTYTVTQGDSITITGTVFEDYACTAIGVTDVTLHATGKSVAPLEITGAEFVFEPEKYEGILLHFVNAVTVTASGTYDMDVTDDGGVSTFILDDDFMIHDSPDDMHYHALAINDVIADLTGICHYYYGNHEVMLRDAADMGVFVSVADDNDLPLKFSLSQNYPNPFNPATTIEYSLARQVKHTLKVYNLRGALVATLVNDVRPAGAYSVTWNANRLASGLYFLRLDAEEFQQTKKMIILK